METKKTLPITLIMLITLIAFTGIIELTTRSSSAKTPEQSPVEVTRQFLQGVAEKDPARVEQTFDFAWADRDLTAKLRALDIRNPWNQRQIADTLLHYFFEADQVGLAKKCLASNVQFRVSQNDTLRLAQVTLVGVSAHRNTSPSQIKVGLRYAGVRWQIVYFPEFYPLDYWKILTGVRAQP
jgi:hypothetical protein